MTKNEAMRRAISLGGGADLVKARPTSRFLDKFRQTLWLTSMKISLPALALAVFAAAHLHGADIAPAATAINSLGIRLLATSGKPKENALLSTYSIQETLAMTYAGADGKTRAEMARVLHYPKDDSALNSAFTSLRDQLKEIHERGEAAVVGAPPGQQRKVEPITLISANRLFAQSGFELRKPYLDLLQESYQSPLEELDFATDPEKAEDHINGWVEEQSLKRIHHAIPEKVLAKDTKLVLVNAIYIKASWENGFTEQNTSLGPFHIQGGSMENVPMIKGLDMHLGYAKRDGYIALTIPFSDSRLQFLVLLPDKINGLASLEARLTPELLAACAKLKISLVDLRMAKFKLEPQVMLLSGQLKMLGIKSAFDHTSADFGRMAVKPRETRERLYVDEVFHKSFLSLDEHGVEATAATSVSMVLRDGEDSANILVDHPFLIAIQDCKSGSCLFLGRVTDPR